MQNWIQWKKSTEYCIVEMKPELLSDSTGVVKVKNLLYFMTLLQILPFYVFSSLIENPKVQVLCSPSVTVISCWSFGQLTSRKISIIWETESYFLSTFDNSNGILLVSCLVCHTLSFMCGFSIFPLIEWWGR